MKLRQPNGLLFEFGPGRPARGIERETIGCGHCQWTKVIYSKDDDLGGVCSVCWRLICGRCVEKGKCTPWEERLEKQEAQFESRRSMGLT